jgi:alkylhydroperoxidase/carboxymuconolactone decarboxylase family protein YurZ
VPSTIWRPWNQGWPRSPPNKLAQRWARPHLSVRERAIACLAVDVLYQTLGESLRLHAALALAAGATEETFRDLIRGMARVRARPRLGGRGGSAPTAPN